MKEKKSPYKSGKKSSNLVKFDDSGYPMCEEHGAMNCVSKDTRVWRCLMCGIGVAFDDIEQFKLWLRFDHIAWKEQQSR